MTVKRDGVTFVDDIGIGGPAIPVSTKTPLTPAAPTSALVGVTSSQIVSANLNRGGLRFVNTSNGKISLGFGSPAISSGGITLFPGGSFNMDEYDFTTAAVNAIAAIESSNISIQEYSA